MTKTPQTFDGKLSFGQVIKDEIVRLRDLAAYYEKVDPNLVLPISREINNLLLTQLKGVTAKEGK